MQDTALVLVDFENEWLDRDSEYFVGDIERTLHRVNKLIEYARKAGHRIIWVTHIEKDSKGAFAPKTKRVRIIKVLDRQKGDIFVKKYKISPFYKTSLERKLKDVRRVIVCGILTNLCVRSMIEGAYDRGFDIDVVQDCCVAYDKATQDFTFNDLASTRPEIRFLNFFDFVRHEY